MNKVQCISGSLFNPPSKTTKREEILWISILFILAITLITFTQEFPFYWDNVIQISVPANYYFDNGFSQFHLPDAIATGHPTFVGMYFASCWKLLGKTLAVTHWSLFPFVFGVLYQVFRLIRNLKVKSWLACFSMFLIIALDTTLLAQLSLITFDIIQLFFFLTCLNLLINHRNLLFGICFLLLMMVSLRGSLIGFGILLAQFVLVGISKKTQSEYYKYIPGLFALGLFLIAFKFNKGWLVHNTGSGNWETAGELASISEMARNVVALGWQLTDYGRIIPFAILVYLIFKWTRSCTFEDTTTKFLLIIGISQLVVLAPILIIYNNPFGHRYFLAAIIPLSMLVAYWISTYSSHPKTFVLVILTVLVSGHFWIYPLKKSQGWDATTLHWSYFTLSEEMHSHVLNEKIQPSDIGTFFPAYKSRRMTHLESSDGAYNGVPFESDYLLYSNAFNVEDKVIEALFSDQSNWVIIKAVERNGIFINLYKVKKSIDLSTTALLYTPAPFP